MSRPHIKISLLSSIFICFCAILMMSHNVGALTLTENVKLQSVYSTGLTVIGPNISYTNVTSASGGTTGAGIETFRLHFNNASCVPGDIYQVNVNLFNTNANDSLDAWASSLYGGDNDFSFIETEYQQLDAGTGQIRFTLACTSTFNNANKYLTLNSATGSAIWLYPQEWITTFYVARYKVLNTDVDAHEIAENAYEINQKIDDIIAALNYNTDAIDTVNDNIESINDDVETSTQNASDAAQDTADSSQAESDATGTSLLSVFTSVIGVIINSQETTCTFDSHLPFMSGAGTIDLCMFQPPAVVQTISSLLALALFVPFGLHMYKRFISITRSFQR